MKPLLTLAEADELQSYIDRCAVSPERRAAAERMLAESRERWKCNRRKPQAAVRIRRREVA